jgi:hypothetical protein
VATCMTQGMAIRIEGGVVHLESKSGMRRSVRLKSKC